MTKGQKYFSLNGEYEASVRGKCFSEASSDITSGWIRPSNEHDLLVVWSPNGFQEDSVESWDVGRFLV